MASNSSISPLALSPLGAGDLIDRAFRFYKQNFLTFIFLASPPILIGTLFSIGWTLLGRVLFNYGTSASGDDPLLSIVFTFFGWVFILFVQLIAILVVMGGASRNFVRHILFGELITFHETYSNVRSRFFGLIAASTIIIVVLSFIAVVVFYLGILVAALVGMLVAYILSFIPPVATVAVVAVTIAVTLYSGWVFFLVASRFAYVPQIMLVEGQSVAAAIGRSTSLASGNVTRIYALFIFTGIAIMSALLLFYVPLGWYVATTDVPLLAADPDALPAWYIIANQVVIQTSLILSSPIIMIGMCLLYVDERVRHEGYDIELMAARNLGEIPSVPTQYSNPLQPAIAAETLVNPAGTMPEGKITSSKSQTNSTLGLS